MTWATGPEDAFSVAARHPMPGRGVFPIARFEPLVEVLVEAVRSRLVDKLDVPLLVLDAGDRASRRIERHAEEAVLQRRAGGGCSRFGLRLSPAHREGLVPERRNVPRQRTPPSRRASVCQGISWWLTGSTIRSPGVSLPGSTRTISVRGWVSGLKTINDRSDWRVIVGGNSPKGRGLGPRGELAPTRESSRDSPRVRSHSAASVRGPAQ